MANPEHLEILAQSVEAWNHWRFLNRDVHPDLCGTNLSSEHLREVNFSFTDLREANLTETYFRKAYLRRANLSGVNLKGADLTKANLLGTDLSIAHLDGVILSEAIVGQTKFIDVDLRVVTGLNSLKHLSPSSISTDTLYRSKGKIPKIFLRGCGLSDVQIEMVKLHNPNLSEDQATDIAYKIIRLLAGGAIKFHSCFISYSHKDEAFAQRIHADLQNKGARCWFAPEDMKIGDKIRPAIDQSIRIHDKLLIILSENSLNSAWVESEVERAFAEERRRKQTVLFPVRLDEDVMETEESWATEIRRTRHIGDFSRWKDHDAYQEAFERLLRDLKAEG